ncbi:MAG: hypothetical protein J7500_15755 [Sphingomonas sp.]|uniref:major capsid protein n=1 Tax=Sphingomonas sp. TaxID=28214 RepID=UPI001B2C1CB2|nr:hypothetical protein [Sphingomonas sp.]MBO9624163.1 hypothetical protein [Sphingomonas sp.]
MATIGNSYLNLIDIYKRSDANKNIVPVIEALNTLNPLMQDAFVVECNQGTKHLTTTRTGLPAVTWGRLYQGIPQSKSTTQQVEDTTGFVEGLSFVDNRLLEISKNPGAVRMSEAQPFLESIAQEVQTNFFYGDTATTPERFKGLGARYNSLANPNVISGGGVGSDNMSIWFVTHGSNQTRIIYPEGTTAGISRKDKGEQRVTDDLGNAYYGKEEEFRQYVGVSVGDWRWNARVANIDVSDLLAGTTDPYKFLRQGYWKLQGRRNGKVRNGGMITPGRTVIYANRDFLLALDAATTNANKVQLTPDEVAGTEVLTYRGIPIRETDALINSEALVS